MSGAPADPAGGPCPLVRLSGVVRRFGPVVALREAELELRAGEVHGILGENGAGKSTLLGVLGGMQRPDEGTLEIDGAEVRLASPRDAWRHGVGLVHQHFTLVPALSVLENLTLGWRDGSGLRLPLGTVQAEADRLVQRTGLGVDLGERVERLGVGDRQRVEILKVLLRRPRVIALDEPTAVLTPAEVASLFDVLRALAAEGRAVALVAHKIDEILGIADRVTVLRDGRTTLAAPRAEIDARELIRAMVGRDVEDRAAVGWGAGEGERPTGRGALVASLADVDVRGRSDRLTVEGASLSVHRGEIVAVAGVEGNGQRELALVLAGRADAERGTCVVPPGVGFVPQDRTLEGLVADFDLVENVALALHDQAAYRRGPLLRWAEIGERARAVRRDFGVVSPGVEVPARALSGGNQQRLVVGREMLSATDLLVAENPTRGLDVGAAAFVHGELRRITASPEGPGVVLISTDLDEVLALGDRIFVMVRGRLLPVGEGSRSRAAVGALMLGGADAGP